MLTSRITEGENCNYLVTIVVISVIFSSLTLYVVWLLYVNYNSQMNK